MGTITINTTSGGEAGTVELSDAVFGIEPNLAVLHQVVTAQLAHRRAGTHSTKTRAEVAGGGAKPWRQKGTGRARQGSIRSPQWRGGGVAHGPKPRDHSKKVNKKVVALALRSALSDRAADGKVLVVDGWGIDAPKTKDGVRVLEALGLRTKGERAPRALLVLFRTEDAAWKSFRNLGERVQVILPEELNAYDVLVNDYIVFSRATLDAVTSRFTGEAAAIGEAVVEVDDSAEVDVDETETDDHAAETSEEGTDDGA
jgi:large subunit ribosomal protein L4